MATIQNRRTTKFQWSELNPVLAAGEIGLEIGVGDDPDRFKIGDGVSPWVDLSYFVGEEEIATTLGMAKKKKFRTNYKPVTGVYPAEKLTIHNHTHDAQMSGYLNVTGTIWNNSKINSQGRPLVAVNPNNIAAGAFVKPSARDVGARHFFGIEITGDKLSVMFQAFGYYDTQAYVLEDGELMKLKDKPMRDNDDQDAGYAGYVFLNLGFKEYKKRTVYINLPFCYLVQVLHESSAVIRRPIDRDMMYVGGDSYSDMGSGFNDYGVDGPTRKALREAFPKAANTYACYGLIEALWEATGIIIMANGQGGTGRMNNGSGVASEARNADAGNCSSFWSPDNIAALQQYPPGSYLAALWFGTINDGELSGGTIAMRDRVVSRLNSIAAWDRGLLLGLVSPEPLNSDGSLVPTGVHALNRLGDLAAVPLVPNLRNGLGYLDLMSPPAWTGVGSIQTDNSSGITQQSQLIGMDGIHGLYQMYNMLGQLIADYFGEAMVPIVRGVF